MGPAQKTRSLRSLTAVWTLKIHTTFHNHFLWEFKPFEFLNHGFLWSCRLFQAFCSVGQSPHRSDKRRVYWLDLTSLAGASHPKSSVVHPGCTLRPGCIQRTEYRNFLQWFLKTQGWTTRNRTGGSRFIQMCSHPNWPSYHVFSKPDLNPCMLNCSASIIWKLPNLKDFCSGLFVWIKQDPPVRTTHTPTWTQMHQAWNLVGGIQLPQIQSPTLHVVGFNTLCSNSFPNTVCPVCFKSA